MAKSKEKKHKKPGQFRSRAKGNAYELHICKLANKHLKKVVTTIETRKGVEKKRWAWNRTARSGGWTQASSYGHLRGMRADLTVDHDCPIFVECKKRESWTLDTLLKSGLKKWEPYLWYREALKKGQATEHPTVLVFSRNLLRGVDYIFLSFEDHYLLTGRNPTYERQILVEEGFVVTLFEPFIKAFVQHQLATRR